MQIKRLLIANRGEIACRIIQTAKRLGIYTIAIYSEADRQAKHVREADEACYVGPAASTLSYLAIDKILAAAKKTQADAIHPGYGFLSENAEFVAACQKAGICFVGPSTDAIKAMGHKDTAKALCAKENIPLIPGYYGDDQSIARLKKEAQRIGYPVLLKAVAGGGGKGMRIVSEAATLEEALASAKREAQSSFGDNHMMLEKYLASSRHVEVQVLADQHGNAIHLLTRDCSIQRRYQKMIEEAPALLPPDVTAAIGETALRVAKAINYINAGTVEFLVDSQHQFYFMEMNTRLQVEHPVTEKITNIDLVEWQLRIAAGEKLTLKQNAIKAHGHAIEARIYAEDSLQGFLPSTGTVLHFHIPALSQNIRLDSAIDARDSISRHYDSMIAKLIVWGEYRAAAVTQLHHALQQLQIAGVATNIAFLLQVAQHSAFQKNTIDTHFLEHHQAALLEHIQNIPLHYVVITSLHLALIPRYEAIQYDHYSPWYLQDSWHNSGTVPYTITLKHQHTLFKVIISASRHKQHYTVQIGEEVWKCVVLDYSFSSISCDINQQCTTLTIVPHDHHLTCFTPQGPYIFEVSSLDETNEGENNTHPHIVAPMPGTVIALPVTVGQTVQAGDPLITLEAMKMEHTLKAPCDAIVEQVRYQIGDQVDEGIELLVLQKELS